MVTVVAVGYVVGNIGWQAVVLNNEVAIFVFILTVTLCHAVAVVRTHNRAKYEDNTTKIYENKG